MRCGGILITFLLVNTGVPYIRVPTTLLAIVDASVGVKNGIDYCSCSLGPQVRVFSRTHFCQNSILLLLQGSKVTIHSYRKTVLEVSMLPAQPFLIRHL